MVLAMAVTSALSSTMSELSGTAWRLVEIASMNDTVERPEDRSSYTLAFGSDGTVSIQSDCNRGMGSWTSESKSQLRFGEIASTKALCLPGSISEKYLSEFKWVRSYVIEDGHLFLATMADGSIIEFEPVTQTSVAATVLGVNLQETDPEQIQAIILDRLFNAYANERGITAEPHEIEAFIGKMDRNMREKGLNAIDDLSEEERRKALEMRTAMARSMIKRWKTNKALYEEYGGRIIYQQLGPEPLDAYRKYLEQRERAGDFQINDEVASDLFWRYFTDDSIHSFLDTGSDEEKSAFSRAPWSR